MVVLDLLKQVGVGKQNGGKETFFTGEYGQGNYFQCCLKQLVVPLNHLLLRLHLLGVLVEVLDDFVELGVDLLFDTRLLHSQTLDDLVKYILNLLLLVLSQSRYLLTASEVARPNQLVDMGDGGMSFLDNVLLQLRHIEKIAFVDGLEVGGRIFFGALDTAVGHGDKGGWFIGLVRVLIFIISGLFLIPTLLFFVFDVGGVFILTDKLNFYFFIEADYELMLRAVLQICQ